MSGATISGSGRHDTASNAITVEAPTCDLDLAALGRSVPALSNIPAPLSSAHVRASVSLDGDARSLAAAHLHLAALDLSATFGHVQGTVDLRGLSPSTKRPSTCPARRSTSTP